MISRDKLLQELKLREYVRKAIKVVSERRENKKKVIELQENKLRLHIRKMLNEAEVDDDVPHHSTGINILEELLKKIIPVLETDYKTLTTALEQRKSFRAHIINAVQSTLAPDIALDKAGVEDSEKIIPVTEQEGDEDLTVSVGDDEEEAMADLGAESDIEADIDADEESFIDINKDNVGKETDSFTISGEDTTGRNMALQSFEKVEKNIVDAYGLLSDEEDEQLFYDYLLTNLKLYFDKFEQELQPVLDEPTTPEYEDEIDREEAEDMEGDDAEMDVGGENELDLGDEELEEDVFSPSDIYEAANALLKGAK